MPTHQHHASRRKYTTFLQYARKKSNFFRKNRIFFLRREKMLERWRVKDRRKRPLGHGNGPLRPFAERTEQSDHLEEKRAVAGPY